MKSTKMKMYQPFSSTFFPFRCSIPKNTQSKRKIFIQNEIFTYCLICLVNKKSVFDELQEIQNKKQKFLSLIFTNYIIYLVSYFSFFVVLVQFVHDPKSGTRRFLLHLTRIQICNIDEFTFWICGIYFLFFYCLI